MSLRFPSALPSILLSALVLLGCGRSDRSSTARNTLRFSIAGDPKGFDPLHSTEESGELVRYLTGGVLVRVNRATDQVESALADSWRVLDGGRAVTFHIRDGAKFSDGQPLTGKDVERTLQTALDPKQASPAGDAFRTKEGTPKIENVSDREITVRYPQPRPDIERLFDNLAITPATNGQPFPSTSGPFHVVEYRPASYVLLRRNPFYSPQPRLETIRLEVQANREIELSKFLGGELDLVNGLEPDAFDRVRAAQPASARNLGPSFSSEFLWFNQAPARSLPEWKRDWFRSAAFRHAVSAAINREDLSRIVFKGYARPAAGPFSPANRFWFNKNLSPRKYDPDAAIALFEKEGFKRRDDVLYDRAGHLVEFSVITNAGNKARERAGAVVQSDLQKIGIKINLVTLEFGSLIDRLTNTWDYEACLLGFANVDQDPAQQNNVWLSSGPTHPWWPKEKMPATPWEAEIDRLTLAQSSETERNLRKKAFDRVQQILFDEEPIIYLVNRDYLTALSPSVSGAEPVAAPPQLVWNIEKLGVHAQ